MVKTLREKIHSDTGSTTVMSVALISVAITLIGAVGFGARVFLIHAQVDTAADLAALAAADVARGLAPGDACSVARKTVQQNGARLKKCSVNTHVGVAEVVATKKLPAPLASLESRAIAGPGTVSLSQ